MATTTTNFGWDIPQSTDLVKDGATAIAALGQDIDTAMVDLKGGTTGQVLAKASGTDLDFSWVAQDDSNAIQNAIVDAKGDLITATAADTPARLAVGTNGHVLTADSAEATGIKWAAPAAGGKVLQVVQATNSTQVNVTSTTYTDTGLSLSITPTSATSKILVFINQSAEITRSAAGAANAVKILRGATDVFVQAGGGYETYAIETSGSSVYGTTIIPMCYLDSPATTSATTYKTQGKVTTASSSASIKFQPGSTGISTITLMEIGA
jgi:hypothetical protein